MALSSELITYIKADTSGFTSAITKAQADASAFGSKTTESLKNLKFAFAALGSGAVIEGLKKAYETVDDIGATASKLDITTQSLQKLQYIAERTDTSFGAVENGLQRLRKTLGDATNGSATANKAFEKLGLNVKELSNGDLGEAYIKVGTAIGKISSSTQQASSAISFFGKNGQEQLNALRSNMSGLAKEAESVGRILSDADFEKFNQLDDSVKNLSFNLKTNLLQAFVSLSPALNAFAEGSLAALQKTQSILANISDSISQAATALDNIDIPFAGLGGGGEYDPNKGRLTPEAFRNRNKFTNVAANATDASSGNIASNVISATQSIVQLGESASSAAANLAAIGTTKLQDLLGINQVSGKSYLSSILPAKEQFKDTQFTALAQQLRDNIENGTTNGGISNDGLLAALKDRARLSDSTRPSDQSNSGIKQAVKELEDAMRGITGDSKVVIDIKVDEQGVIKALASSNSARILFQNTMKASVASEAAVSAAAGG